MTPEAIVNDLSMFADLGTSAPQLVEAFGSYVIRLVRDGVPVTVTIAADGRVRERIEADERKHASFRALLASPNWANLGKWADSQRTLLQDRVAGDTIPVAGSIAHSQDVGGVDLIDSALIPGGTGPRTQVLLIDGPAGIGKTSLIRSLAHKRAVNFRRDQWPLILHVESRGRMLQNITDLMAFSLQTLRLSVTYDQVPVLVRHGLVTLAIDGFDELGDPNGYDLAWAQVNDLVVEARGQGQIILAGRETFIGRERMKKALTAIDENVDRLEAFTLRPIEPNAAREWLAGKGWAEDLLSSETASSLFERESYALRPFFLSELARDGVAEQIQNGDIGDLLSFLITAMINREAQKFGKDIEAVTTLESRTEFVIRVMEEVARDLAENQSNAIPSDTLTWLAEISAEDIVPASLSGILKNRSGVLAFLKDDDRRGYKNFAHEQVYNYFLARVTIRSISQGEIPKFVRRNIFGSDFLESFSEVFRSASGDDSENFIRRALENFNGLGEQDRARQNIASLVLSACCVFTPSEVPVLRNVLIDEVFLTETVTHLHLQNTTINQLSAAGADMRALHFDAPCAVYSLIADGSTIPHPSIPTPTVVSLPDRTTYDPEEIGHWLQHQFSASIFRSGQSLSDAFRDFGLFDLLARVARYKPYWIKDGDEKGARRILDDENWPALKEILVTHGLLIERTDVPASGRPAPFYHIKNRTALMNLDNPEDAIGAFFSDVFEASMKLEDGTQ
jgi:hypothetical protein